MFIQNVVKLQQLFSLVMGPQMVKLQKMFLQVIIYGHFLLSSSESLWRTEPIVVCLSHCVTVTQTDKFKPCKFN